MQKTTFTSGKLATKAGVNKETLRYYERNGLLPKPARTESGYRLFSESDVRRIAFIKNAQALGFSLREIRELLAIVDGDLTDRNEVRELAEKKIEQIETQLSQLTHLRITLIELVDRCAKSGSTCACPIIESLTETERPETLRIEKSQQKGTCL